MTNTVLVGCDETKRAVVVDAPFESAELLVTQCGIYGLSIEKILLTHSHWDHIGDLAQLKELTGASVSVHHLDRRNVEEPGSDGVPGPGGIRATEVEYELGEGDEISVGSVKLKVMHTPGHTPGGVCFLVDGVLLSGDTLFCGSIGRLDLSTAEPEKMWSSLARLAALPKETRVIPGHGDETTIGKENWLPNARKIFGG